MNQSLTVSYQTSSGGIDDEYFIRLEQVGTEETATLGEIAALVDDLFEINPCVPEEEEEVEAVDPSTVEEPPEEEEEPTVLDFVKLSEAVKRLMAMSLCEQDAAGNWYTQVKVIRSHINEQYALKFIGGEEIKRVVVEETVDDLIAIEDAAGVTLDYPVISGFIAEWNGSAVGGNGVQAGPTITRTGNTLNWGTPLSGSIRVQYRTQYNLVDVLVYGNDDFSLGDCKVIAFFYGLVDELDLEQPEQDGTDEERDDYCDVTGDKYVLGSVTGPEPLPVFYITQTRHYCSCSGDYAYSKYSPDPPDDFYGRIWNKVVRGEYVDCNEETAGSLADPEYYAEKCCKTPDVILPKCQKTRRLNPGGHTMSVLDLEPYQQTYGDSLEVRQVSPADGDCGDTTYYQDVDVKNCCEDVEPMSWDPDFSPTVVPGLFHILGGQPPFDIHVEGEGFSLSPYEEDHHIIDYDGWFRVYLEDEACGGGSIIVTDACDQELTKSIRTAEGSWVLDKILNDWSPCEIRPNCCSKSWMPCDVADPADYGRDQCQTYYSGGLNYIQGYQPTWEVEDGEYKIKRMECEGHRSCVGSMTCFAVQTCTMTDDVSGLSYAAVLPDPCYSEFGDKIMNSRYKWVC